MIQADNLNRDAALLSNTLADFDDDDVAGRKVVVDQIRAIREQWKNVRYEIDTGQPRQAEKVEKPTSASTGLSDAEIKLEVAQIRKNISKNRSKLATTPAHKNAPVWEAEIGRLQSLLEAYQAELTERKYANVPKND